MRDADMEAYHEYVTARMHRLRRFGYLICGSWHTADDLVSTVLYKLYRQWGKVSALENVDAYVRRMLVRTWARRVAPAVAAGVQHEGHARGLDRRHVRV
ncbi:sigma factor [Fodinicola feengrottensis]|uniref:sigma factor n=1 Tax=Fodinicola feengrottensis TaxID=435914 RepID=UPI002442D411|nr:sigma factor [Fodinicola feengrottensis]